MLPHARPGPSLGHAKKFVRGLILRMILMIKTYQKLFSFFHKNCVYVIFWLSYAENHSNVFLIYVVHVCKVIIKIFLIRVYFLLFISTWLINHYFYDYCGWFLSVCRIFKWRISQEKRFFEPIFFSNYKKNWAKMPSLVFFIRFYKFFTLKSGYFQGYESIGPRD